MAYTCNDFEQLLVCQTGVMSLELLFVFTYAVYTIVVNVLSRRSKMVFAACTMVKQALERDAAKLSNAFPSPGISLTEPTVSSIAWLSQIASQCAKCLCIQLCVQINYLLCYVRSVWQPRLCALDGTMYRTREPVTQTISVYRGIHRQEHGQSRTASLRMAPGTSS